MTGKPRAEAGSNEREQTQDYVSHAFLLTFCLTGVRRVMRQIGWERLMVSAGSWRFL